MMGLPLFNFCHPGDAAKLQHYTSPREQQEPASPGSLRQIVSLPNVSSKDNQTNVGGAALRQSFYIRLKEKPVAKHDKPQYQHMHIVGHLRRSETHDGGSSTDGQSTFIGVMRPIRDRLETNNNCGRDLLPPAHNIEQQNLSKVNTIPENKHL